MSLSDLICTICYLTAPLPIALTRAAKKRNSNNLLRSISHLGIVKTICTLVHYGLEEDCPLGNQKSLTWKPVVLGCRSSNPAGCTSHLVGLQGLLFVWTLHFLEYLQAETCLHLFKLKLHVRDSNGVNTKYSPCRLYSGCGCAKALIKCAALRQN